MVEMARHVPAALRWCHVAIDRVMPGCRSASPCLVWDEACWLKTCEKRGGHPIACNPHGERADQWHGVVSFHRVLPIFLSSARNLLASVRTLLPSTPGPRSSPPTPRPFHHAHAPPLLPPRCGCGIRVRAGVRRVATAPPGRRRVGLPASAQRGIDAWSHRGE
jgi:hypothetical protein